MTNTASLERVENFLVQYPEHNFSITELAASISMNRFTCRDAVLFLEKYGRVSIEHNRGARYVRIRTP